MAMTLMTVIIATYNRCESLRQVLSSLLSQECDGSFDFEIIVADNNSSDRTKELVKSMAGQSRGKFHYIFEPLQGKTKALNRAVAQAKGEILVFTDDDVSIPGNWLTNVKRCFDNFHCDGLGGRILPQYPAATPQWVKDNMDILRGALVAYDLGEETKPCTKPMEEFWGANYAFRKEIFEECGLFRTDIGVGSPYLGEDTEFVNRLQNQNKKLYYCGNALIWHPVNLKRLKLGYIARWNMALGRYRMLTSEYKTLPDKLVYYFGVPRYLLLKMFKTSVKLMASIFDKRQFLKYWIQLSIDRGRADEIRLLRIKNV